MNQVDVFGRCDDNLKELAEKVALEVVNFKGLPKFIHVDVKFVSETEIQQLNKEFRNIDKVTDVLSFPFFSILPGEKFKIDKNEFELYKNEKGMIQFGDMAICTKRLREQAKQYGVSVESELKKLVIHSMLHFLGYDHIKDEDFEVMKVQEQILDEKIKI